MTEGDLLALWRLLTEFHKAYKLAEPVLDLDILKARQIVRQRWKAEWDT